MAKLFGTDGIRIDVEKEGISPEFFSNIASSICESFGKGSVFLLGRDIRHGGELIFNSIVAGLTSSGCTVHDSGLITTPALQYNVKVSSEFDGGIMITASHNPPNYNGIKVIDSDGIEIPREKEKEIEEIFFNGKFSRIVKAEMIGRIFPFTNAIERYISGVLEHVDDEVTKKRRGKILIDAANSVGSLVLPEIAKRLGWIPISINSHLDPEFPGREPEPTPETLYYTSKAIVAFEAELGIAVDGDADRSIFLDEQGNAYWGDRTALVLAPYIKEKFPELPSRVYTGISSSYFIEDLFDLKGISVVWMKVGSVDIARRLKREGGLLGFEENGGIMFPPHQYVRDAGMALALMIEFLSREKIKSSQAYSAYPKTFTLKTKYPFPRDRAEELYKKVREKFKNYRQIDIDGIKVLLEDSWFLVRMSGTEPVVRVMVESKTEGKEKFILKELEKIITG